MRQAATWCGCVAALVVVGACELEVPIGRLPSDVEAPRALQGSGALDILVVVDNSNSMADEQEALARALFREDCPIQSLDVVPDALKRPTGALLDELEGLCGFAQILAAYERDFRVGVITTDVNACDNAIPSAQGGAEWGHRPQRGCLQPVPSTGQKVISRDDLDIAPKFTELMSAIGTHGSPFERGLDAVDALFAGDAFDASCAGDLEELRRADADLLIVFVTDEDDCSHGGGAHGFDDETLEVCGPGEALVTDHRVSDCYDAPDTLAPVAAYAERWRAIAGAGALRVLVVGGAVPTGDDGAPHAASGCVVDGDGAIGGACWASGGLSNFTDPGQPCDPSDPGGARGGQPCCLAESARRYEALAALVDGRVRSICGGDYVGAMTRALQD